MLAWQFAHMDSAGLLDLGPLMNRAERISAYLASFKP